MNPKAQVDWDQEEPFPSQHKVEGGKNLIFFLSGRIYDFCNRHRCQYQTKIHFSAHSDDLQRNKIGIFLL